MLDLSFEREGTPPKDATTLILLRDAAEGVELFCVERNKKSRFLGGAIVFPGGKLDEADAQDAWNLHVIPFAQPMAPIARDEDHMRALGVCACRETLEEASILPTDGAPLSHEEVLAVRDRVKNGASFLEEIARIDRKLSLASLVPLSRWVTPAAEARRYDARFFVCKAPHGQHGAHDEYETTSSFWARPSSLLDRFAKKDVGLAPPTHRTIEILATCKTADDVIAYAQTSNKNPICPVLRPQLDDHGETLALVLPGDREHSVTEVRSPGKSRYVLRGDVWLPEDDPHPKSSRP